MVKAFYSSAKSLPTRVEWKAQQGRKISRVEEMGQPSAKQAVAGERGRSPRNHFIKYFAAIWHKKLIFDLRRCCSRRFEEKQSSNSELQFNRKFQFHKFVIHFEKVTPQWATCQTTVHSQHYFFNFHALNFWKPLHKPKNDEELHPRQWLLL